MSEPEYPEYPYFEQSELLEIYKSLTDNDEYRDWFVNDNGNMYEKIKMYKLLELHYILVGYDSDLEDIVDESNEDLFVDVYHYEWDYIKNIDYKIKQWFETDERIKRYDDAIIKYETYMIKYYGDNMAYGFKSSYKSSMNKFFTHQYRFTDSSDDSSSERSGDDSSESQELGDDC